jgi:hypothetical protein
MSIEHQVDHRDRREDEMGKKKENNCLDIELLTFPVVTGRTRSVLKDVRGQDDVRREHAD